MTKNKLFTQLHFISTPELREVVNQTIAINRNLTIDKAKLKRYLYPNEVLRVKEYFGVETV